MKAVGYLVGAGSMTLGVEAAGFEIAQVFETPGYAKNARTWNLNRPNNRFIQLDLNERMGIPCGPIDMVYGNPPCGGMSSMTGGHIESPTNNLMVSWVQMVVNTRPRYILMENAYQIATERGYGQLQKLVHILQTAGYYWWVWQFYSWQLGCPQRRRRAFLCASLDRPVHAQYVDTADLPLDFGNMKVMDYIWDLEEIKPSPDPVTTATGKKVTMHWYDNASYHVNELIPQYLPNSIYDHFMTTRELEKIREGGTEKEWEKARKAMTEGTYFWDAPHCFVGMQQFRRPHITPTVGPANTVLSDMVLLHPTKTRLMTHRESARLMGYPDEWQFHECKPYLIAQGVPSWNAYWAADRILRVVGLR